MPATQPQNQTASPAAARKYRIALTAIHAMSLEVGKFPAANVEYTFIEPKPLRRRWVRSGLKAYLGHYHTDEHDLIETFISPIITDNSWICSLENFQAATSFSFLGLPLPRSVRIAYVKHLMLKENFKKLVFWSQAGKRTLRDYGRIRDPRILDKVEVVYPAVRPVSQEHIRFNDRPNVRLLFSGDFFRKGGVNVIDAFERAQQIYPDISLRLCCDENADFRIENAALKNQYLDKIKANPAITLGRVSRDQMLGTILPQTDIYLLPTYSEAFGFAILEAMAYGIPVIATNGFAIPEMIQHNATGLLIDIERFDCDELFKGYVVRHIPPDFRAHVTDRLFDHLCALIESPARRKQLGSAALDVARTKFSFTERNKKMRQIYQSCLS